MDHSNDGGLLCLLDVVKSRVIRTIKFNQKVMIVETKTTLATLLNNLFL